MSLNRNSLEDFKEPLEIKAARFNLQLRKLIKAGKVDLGPRGNPQAPGTSDLQSQHNG